MSSLQTWSIVVILYQTIICVAFSWWTLDCRFTPNSSELHEITLMKLLYLYDPEACGRVYFYNVTSKDATELSHSSVMWPVRNKVAASFRAKLKLWLALHVSWLALGVAAVTHEARPCGFYAILVPFTLTGLSLMIIDLIYTGLFIKDIEFTGTEVSILIQLNENPGDVEWATQPVDPVDLGADTSWISLIFAYCSCRGIVQWIINYWLIKDMYFEGLEEYLLGNMRSHHKISRAFVVLIRKNLDGDQRCDNNHLVSSCLKMTDDQNNKGTISNKKRSKMRK